MKTSPLAVASLASLAQALGTAQNPNPDGQVTIDCAKPNANFCAPGGVIVRCNAQAIGTTALCSDILADDPPTGGMATCWESSKLAGDAACEKNCVVYAQPSFALSGSQCPSTSATSIAAVSSVTAASDTSASSSAVTTVTSSTSCTSATSMSYSNSSMRAPTTTSTMTPASINPGGVIHTSNVTVPMTTLTSEPAPSTTMTKLSSVITVYPSTTSAPALTTTMAASTMPAMTSSMTPNVSTGAGVMNKACGALAGLGLVAAYLL